MTATFGKNNMRFLQCGHSNRDTWKKIVQSRLFWKKKIKILKFFSANEPVYIFFNNCFQRGLVSLNGFLIVLNGCIVKS